MLQPCMRVNRAITLFPVDKTAYNVDKLHHSWHGPKLGVYVKRRAQRLVDLSHTHVEDRKQSYF